MLIKYIKGFLWRTAIRLSYLKGAWCLEVKGFLISTLNYKISRFEGRALTQAVSRRSFVAEAWVQSQASPCRVWGGQSGTATGFTPSTFIFPSQYHFTDAPFSLITDHRHCIISAAGIGIKEHASKIPVSDFGDRVTATN